MRELDESLLSEHTASVLAYAAARWMAAGSGVKQQKERVLAREPDVGLLRTRC